MDSDGPDHNSHQVRPRDEPRIERPTSQQRICGSTGMPRLACCFLERKSSEHHKNCRLIYEWKISQICVFRSSYELNISIPHPSGYFEHDFFKFQNFKFKFSLNSNFEILKFKFWFGADLSAK